MAVTANEAKDTSQDESDANLDRMEDALRKIADCHKRMEESNRRMIGALLRFGDSITDGLDRLSSKARRLFP